jgi:hypothetical protein
MIQFTVRVEKKMLTEVEWNGIKPNVTVGPEEESDEDFVSDWNKFFGMAGEDCETIHFCERLGVTGESLEGVRSSPNSR